MGQGETHLSIGDVVERTGLTAHTLRYYEREGVLPDPVERNESGHRVYTDDDVEWLLICKSLRASGMSLTEIREYVALVKSGAGNEPERVGLLRRHQKSLMSQIEELKQCFDWIEHKIGFYERQLTQEARDSSGSTAPAAAALRRARGDKA